MSQQGLRQASFRTIHGGDGLTYNGDAMAAMEAEILADDAEADVASTYNGRFIQWLQLRLSSSNTSLPGLAAEFAADVGADKWSSVGSFDAME